MSEFIKAWHGCLEHNRNHCPDCRVCICYESVTVSKRESRTEMNTIEITRPEDVREGDMVTMSKRGHEFFGVAWYNRDRKCLCVGDSEIKWYRRQDEPDAAFASFVRATREVPALPTKEGSVIVNATIRAETGHTAILDDDGSWFTPRPVGGVFYLHSPESITYWEAARIVREDEQA